MKRKRLISLLLAFVLMVSATLSVNLLAMAESVTFNYVAETGLLTIRGMGEIEDYNENNLTTRPWNVYADSAKKIVIEEGITKVGDYAFARFSAIEEVEFSSTVTTIGKAAFSGNDTLVSITVPDTVTAIGDFAFGFSYDMTISKNFVAKCGVKSAAQAYCFKNYVPFETPLQDGTGVAHITSMAEMIMWSFVAPADGKLVFNSIGGKDTRGLLFDADSYAYNSNIAELKRTALAESDDVGSNVNFKINYNVEAGKRYYLVAAFTLNDRYDGSDVFEDGRFTVQSDFTCTNHTAADPIIENEVKATCTEGGSYTQTLMCSVCDKQISKENVNVDPLGHSFTDYVSNNDATCTVDATETAKCDRCDAIDTHVVENSALGHDFATTVIAPTCEDEGYTIYACKRCEYKYNGDYVDPVPHTPTEAVEENKVDATCTQSGSYDLVVYCDECGEELSREQVGIDALGHSFTNYVSNNDATCTKNATETAKCDRCDAENTREIENSALGHKYASSTTAPTCTKQGYTTYTCGECGDSYVDNYVDPLGHSAAAAVEENRIEATCTVAGSYDMVTYCGVCTEELSREQFVIEATGHEFVVESFVEGVVTAICSNDGCEETVMLTFMDFYNTEATEENAILDVVEDGFINAKDFAKLLKDQKARDLAIQE